jgi:hypothetical protein
MNVFYRIQHNGEEIAAADTLEKAKAIVRDSRPGAYGIVEVRDGPQPHGRRLTRNWGHLIHPDDGPVFLDPAESAEREATS